MFSILWLPGRCALHANRREAIPRWRTLPLLAGQNVGSRFVVPGLHRPGHSDCSRTRRRTPRARDRGRARPAGGDVIERADVFTAAMGSWCGQGFRLTWTASSARLWAPDSQTAGRPSATCAKVSRSCADGGWVAW